MSLPITTPFLCIMRISKVNDWKTRSRSSKFYETESASNNKNSWDVFLDPFLPTKFPISFSFPPPLSTEINQITVFWIFISQDYLVVLAIFLFLCMPKAFSLKYSVDLLEHIKFLFLHEIISKVVPTKSFPNLNTALGVPACPACLSEISIMPSVEFILRKGNKIFHNKPSSLSINCFSRSMTAACSSDYNRYNCLKTEFGCMILIMPK